MICLHRWVDEIITNAPWVITEEYINKHKIDFVAHDALPYSDASGQAADVYDFVSRHRSQALSLYWTSMHLVSGRTAITSYA